MYIDDCGPDKDTDGIQVDSSTPLKPLKALALRKRLFLIDGHTKSVSDELKSPEI